MQADLQDHDRELDEDECGDMEAWEELHGLYQEEFADDLPPVQSEEVARVLQQRLEHADDCKEDVVVSPGYLDFAQDVDEVYAAQEERADKSEQRMQRAGFSDRPTRRTLCSTTPRTAASCIEGRTPAIQPV